jgi:hypothetical protein
MDDVHQNSPKTPEAQKAKKGVECTLTQQTLFRLLEEYDDNSLTFLGNVEAQAKLTIIFNRTGRREIQSASAATTSSPSTTRAHRALATKRSTNGKLRQG